MANSGSSTGNTTTFHSILFRMTVRSYCGYVIVPFEVTGPRGGTKRVYDIYSNDQQTCYNRGVKSLAKAKGLIDAGRVKG